MCIRDRLRGQSVVDLHADRDRLPGVQRQLRAGHCVRIVPGLAGRAVVHPAGGESGADRGVTTVCGLAP